MKAKPILFAAPMVRAILDGRKTVTRRAVKAKPSEAWTPYSYGEVHKMVNGEPSLDKVIGWGPSNEDGDEAYALRYSPGDRLWVRETWTQDGVESGVAYRADGEAPKHLGNVIWRPSIFMPRWASRIMLEVTGVKVERLQDITEAEAIAEGMIHPRDPSGDGQCAIEAFSYLWNGINAKRAGCAWADNPWVAAISFRRVSP